MKKTKYILKGFLAVVMAVMFVQCAGNNGETTQTAAPVAANGTTNMKIAYVEIDSLLTKYRFWNDLNELMIKKEEKETTQTAAPVAANGTTNMKIAYVEIDSLLTKYRFWNDLNELMIKKEENIRTTLNEKAKALDAAMKEFQRKYENNGFVSAESAQQQQSRIIKQQQDLQALQDKLSKELADENQKNSLQLRDSINSFLKIYNKDKGYSLIISNTGFDNLLYADPAFNITQEIVDGLNARYSGLNK